MSYTTRIMIVSVMMLLASVTIGGVYASTVTVSGGQISQVGNEVSVPISMDIADNGLIYDQMRITVADPTIAEVTKVDFPSWANLNNVATTLPASVVVATAGDLSQNPKNPPGATNVPIATVTLKGLKVGTTQINLDFVGQGLGGVMIHPAIQAGTLKVNGVAPTPTTVVPTTSTPVPTTTTVIPTTSTPVPTTVVPTTPTPLPTPVGPTGQVYFSTTPQGAAIIIDGVASNGVTPFIIPVPVGSHQVVFRLAGYNELQAGFTAQQSSMTTVSRRLSPGGSIIPTTRVTTVATTVPGTSVTPITTVPTTGPTVLPTTVPTGDPYSWLYQVTVPSWFKTYIPFF